MRIGLYDVDSKRYPNLALMKISAYHKTQGDSIEWWFGIKEYDKVYISKVFDDTYSYWYDPLIRAEKVQFGGTGFVSPDGGVMKTRFHFNDFGGNNEIEPEKGIIFQKELPPEIEHMKPDWSIYPELTKDTAFGFLTRGCPRMCGFCIVASKEGRKTQKVADLAEWWSGQKNIELMDPNLLAAQEHIELLEQLAKSGANVNVSQGIDCRLLTTENIHALNKVNMKMLHFAWDTMEQSQAVIDGLKLYTKLGRVQDMRKRRVYVLVNFGTTIEENLYRIYTLKKLGYDPYVMIFNKPTAPQEIRHLQRWVNNKFIFRSCECFEDYKWGKRRLYY